MALATTGVGKVESRIIAPMELTSKNALMILGPTASGKTQLGVQLAQLLGGEIISADSRQVYRGLDIGSGKDLDEYTINGVSIPYHLIDIVDLDEEFSVFAYQQAFYNVFETLQQAHHFPIVVGGTGMYLDAVLQKHRMVAVPENPALRETLAAFSMEALVERLRALKPNLHNSTDLTERERLVRAIEIAEYTQNHAPEPAPDIRPLVLGVEWPRETLRKRIALRLHERLESGMIEEVETLHAQGYSWERLELLGLEYRFVAQFLQGEIKNRNDLFQKLYAAITRFAKRQDTWFRRMERNGVEIHWTHQGDLAVALQIIRDAS